MGRTQKKDIQEECEDTNGLIKGRTPKRDRKEEFEDTKGVFMDRTPKKDRQEEFEDTTGVVRAVHRRMTHKKRLKIQKE